MSSSALKLYKQEPDGTLVLEDSLIDSFYKCAIMFSEIDKGFITEAEDTFRIDLVDASERVTASKLCYGTGHLTIGQIA